ncbi:MAG: methyltransferase domain-containing protein [Desulfobulbus sp.]|nr:methyltransferase domain-containing protein [Desulfobulbus sp.]
MKARLLDLLVCPLCLPAELYLTADISAEQHGDIATGSLYCPQCGTSYPIVDGVALLDPQATDTQRGANKYETDEVLSSYLWSHFSDLLDGEEQSSQAYAVWAGMMRPQRGVALDAGSAVGRFTFEMSARCDFAIGIDTSQAFIRAARRLMRERSMAVALKDEGLLVREITIHLPDAWHSDRVEFIVANAQALPFRQDSIALFSSLNLVDKVPDPLRHLREMNRVIRNAHAQFLLSDPFSWSTEAAPVEAWLGGKKQGRFAGKGLANVAAMLADEENELVPSWRVGEPGSVWWTIRTHSNHYELIRSCFIRAER